MKVRFWLIIMFLILIVSGTGYGLYSWQFKEKKGLMEEYQSITQLAENAVEIDYNTFKKQVEYGWEGPTERPRNENIDYVVVATNLRDSSFGDILGKYSDGGYFIVHIPKESGEWLGAIGWLSRYGIPVQSESAEKYETLIASLIASGKEVETIHFDVYLMAVESGYKPLKVWPKNKNIKWVIKKTNPIDSSIGDILGEYTDGTYFTTYLHISTKEWNELNAWLAHYDVSIKSVPIIPRTHWTQHLIWAAPTFLLVVVIGLGMWWMLTKGPLSGLGKQFLKSKGKTEKEYKTKVYFADVAGVDEAKEESQEVVDYLHDREPYDLVGAKMPHGILYYGPPGTGKTLMAQAVADEAGVPQFSISGSEFHEMFVGVGAARARGIFDQAIVAAPSTLRIDEIDSAAPRRTGMVSFHNEEASLVNQLLSLLDYIEKENIPVFFMGITNRPDILDPALLRPGRLDRHIEVPLPDAEGRVAILKVHIERAKPRPRPVDPDLDYETLARETEGFSGAYLATLVNEAALRVARTKGERKIITLDDFRDSVDRVLMGPRKKLKLREIEKEILPWHEAGHAMAAKLLPETDPVHYVTIYAYGRSLGHTRFLPEGEHYIYTDTEVFNQVKVFLAGRAAEEIVFEKFSSGCAGDLEQATSLVRNAICIYGMGELGPIHIRNSNEAYWSPGLWSEKMTEQVDNEIQKLLRKNYEIIRELLQEEDNFKKLEALAKTLAERKRIPGADIDAIIG